MSATKKPPRGLRHVRAHRVSTNDAETRSAEETVGVVLEAPLTIDVLGVGSYTIMCTPGERRALALGFLFTDGLIDGMDDVASVKPCRSDPTVVRVILERKPARIAEQGRSLLIVSSCGACGTEDLEARLDALPVVGDTLRIESGLLRSVSDALCENQPLFEACGGTHAAAIFDGEGKILSCAEDAGRHSALDKAIGKCLLLGASTTGCGVMLSGRSSMEMVGKCARAGIEIIAAVSAPTSLALHVAERCGITLCSFVRETRATIFTRPERVTGVTENRPSSNTVPH
jgi:FdhD protein